MQDGDKAPHPVTSLFVPPFGLQGQKLSCHILWTRSAALVNLQIACGDGLSCLHVYNVPEEGVVIREEGKEVNLVQASENGYIGFVLQSKHLRVPDANVEVTLRGSFREKDQQLSFQETRKVKLFRPDLAVEEMPHSIRVEFAQDRGSPKVMPRIRMANRGKGSALVAFTFRGPSGATAINYFEEKGERERYVRVLSEHLSSLKLDYPARTSFIDLMIDLLETFSKPDSIAEEQTLRKFEHFKEAAQRIEKEDTDLIGDIAAAFGDALLATFSLDLRFIAWTQSLQASREERIFLLNPWSAVPIKSGGNEVSVEVRYIDFIGHEYPKIDLGTLIVESNSAGLLPLFELLEVVRSADQRTPPQGGG